MIAYFVYMNDVVISSHDFHSDARSAIFTYRHVLDIAGVDPRVFDFKILKMSKEDV